MKKIKRITSIVLVIVFGLMQISCDFAKETETEPEPENITISIWNIWTTDVDANRKSFFYAIEELEQKYPNVNFEIVSTETETYKTRIKTSVAVNDVPDIFFSWGAGFSQPFAETDKILNLDKYYNDELKKRLPEETLKYQTYDGSLYGLPFMRVYAVLYINEEMVNSYGYTLPLYYDDFISLSEELAEDNIVPIATAGTDKWSMMFHYATLCLREMGPDKVQKTLDGELSFKQEGFIRAAEKLQEMVEIGAFGTNYLNTGYEEAADMLYNGEAAMFYMGNWASGGFTSDKYVSDKITASPYILTGGSYDDAVLGGTVDCFMISKDTEHPDLAFDMVVTITETLSEYGPPNGMGFPAWDKEEYVMTIGEGQNNEDFALMEKIYNDTVSFVDSEEGSVIWWDSYLGGEGPAVNQLILDLAAKELTPMEFAEKMDKLLAEE